MSNKVKTVKISTLIKRLQELQNTEGDLPIIIAKDQDGKAYSTIDPNDDIDYSVDNDVLVLYPSSEIKNINDTINDFEEEDLEEPRCVDDFDWGCDSYEDSDEDDEYYEGDY